MKDININKVPQAKNVILMVPDGMSVEAYSFARWLAGEEGLALDGIMTGMVRINNSNVPMADSAPAASAMATGYKSQATYISSYPSEAGMPGTEDYDLAQATRPLATVLEGAKLTGRARGLVTTARVNHATPAAFGAHVLNREALDTIMDQLVHQDIDVVLGAGSSHLDKNLREDGQDLKRELISRGYDYVTSPAELAASKSDRLWGLFAPYDLDHDLDRDPQVEPSLRDMTAKALEVLSRKEEGFFLMVEGSQIDWSAHGNDPVGLATDILAFDRALALVLDFARSREDTVLVVAADHGTGGFSMGSRETSLSYTRRPLKDYTSLIRNAKKTGRGAGRDFNHDRTNIREVMEENFGILDLSQEEEVTIREMDDPQTGIGLVISKRAGLGWTSYGHTGGDVALYSYSSQPGLAPLSGLVFNHEIGTYLAGALGLDLDGLTESLYAPAEPALAVMGLDLAPERSGGEVTGYRLGQGARTLFIPINKDYLLLGGRRVYMPGLSLANGDKLYLAQETLDWIRAWAQDEDLKEAI